MELPLNVELIITMLEQQGHEAFVVGGCVRDVVRGVPPKDWDICTSALPEETADCFEGYHLINTGLKHGTVTLMLQGEPYEITTYRTDGAYSDGRHPDAVAFVGDLNEDLARRDFTMNAMAFNPQTGLIDPFSGTADIEKRVIRAVGVADQRFREDALRIMRALRFASTLEFSLEQETAAAILNNKYLLHSISAERIALELNAILLGSNVESVLLEYAQVIAVPISEIGEMVGFKQNNPYHYLDVWQHTVQSIAHAPQELNLRLALLLHDIAKPHCYTEADGVGHFYGHPQVSAEMAQQILKRLRFSRETINTVTELVLYHDAQIEPQEKCIKRWLNRIGEERLRQLLEIQRADSRAHAPHCISKRLVKLDELERMLEAVLQQQQCFSRKDLAISGSDLIAAGIPEGKEIGLILDELLDRVINDTLVNERDVLLGYVDQIHLCKGE